MKKQSVGIVACALALASGSPSGAGDYVPGYEWTRVIQSPPLQVVVQGENYMRGNPWIDPQRTFVWSFEHYTSNGGDGFGGDPNMPPTPWFQRESPRLLEWDGDYRGTLHGSWVFDDDTPCRVNDVAIIHEWGALDGEAWRNVPAVRWRNPIGDNARTSIAGQLVVEWEGGDGEADQLVDIALVHDKRVGLPDPRFAIFSTTLSRADGSKQVVPISIPDFRPNAGESLIVTAKARVSGPAVASVARVSVKDELTITLERAPRGYCPEDFNRDGIVDFADLNRILFLFGLGCDEIP